MQEGCSGSCLSDLGSWAGGSPWGITLKMRACPGPSAGPQITEAEMADHNGKAFGSCLLLRFSNWDLVEDGWSGRDPHIQAGCLKQAWEAKAGFHTPGFNTHTPRLHLKKMAPWLTQVWKSLIRAQCPCFIDEETENQTGKVIRPKQSRLPLLPKGEEIKDFAGGWNPVQILGLQFKFSKSQSSHLRKESTHIFLIKFWKLE